MQSKLKNKFHIILTTKNYFKIMEFFNTYFLDIIKNKYALFDGRARRKEFWMFVLVNVLISTIFMIIMSIGYNIASVLGWLLYAIYGVFELAILVPYIALGIRRIHDTNHSGWWVIVPFANLLLFLEKGTEGDNEYGSDPKAGE